MIRNLLTAILLLVLLPRTTLPQNASYQQAIRLLTEADDEWQSRNIERAAGLMRQAAQEVRRLSQDLQIPPAERKGLVRMAEELLQLSVRTRSQSSNPKLKVYLDSLAETRRFFPKLRTTYVETTMIERGGGGHARAPGKPPPIRSSVDDIAELGDRMAVIPNFREVPLIAENTYFGTKSKDHILESTGGGVALFDYDNDGWLDIYVVNAMEITSKQQLVPHRNVLYRNRGDWKFESVARRAGVDAAAWGCGACVGDYNNDGHLDLYVTNFGPNLLYRGNGDGTFRDVAGALGVDHSGWSTGCAFFDADGDGDLDLYVANYLTASWAEVLGAERTRLWRGGPKVMFGPTGLPAAADVFYRNEGKGGFSDSTRASGLATPEAYYGFGVLAADYNRDGLVDLYVANDSNPNLLFRNQGGGHFDEVGLASGVALSADGREQAGMGVDIGDFDADARLDLVVTNFAHDANTLYRNLGDGLFEDVTQPAGLYSRTFKRLGWGVSFLDSDLDGDLDLFVANGHIFPQVDQHPQLRESFRQKNQLLINEAGKFWDVSEAAGNGLQVEESSRALGVGDLDNDGDLDLVVSNMDQAPSVLENRTKTTNHWIGLNITKEGRNHFCIGARVTITAEEQTQVREIRSGGTYLSQSDLRVYFGLGSHAGRVDVEVVLPGGGRWVSNGLEPDRLTSLMLRERDQIKQN